MVLAEQPGTTVMKQGKVDTTGLVVPFDAKKIADLIYNAKGYVVDDEELAKEAIIKNIKNIAQYKQVNSELYKLSNKRGIGAYLGSFVNLTDRLEIAGNLMNVLPKNQWEWTIKKIVPWEDFKWVNFGKKYNGLPLIARWPGDTPETALAINTAIKFVTTIYNTEWQTREAQVLSVIDHNILTIGQIVLAFVPVVGWAMSAGIGLGNAKLYYDEGDPKTAGIEAIFSLIPGLGLAGRLGLNKIAPKVMADLGKKVATKQTKNLTKQEIYILNQLGKNQKAFKTELDNYFKTGIKKSVNQISRDKLAAAGKQLGIGATKTSATLASYVTIAQLYGNIYDANIELINDTELLALNNKLDADFAQWLDTKYKSNIADAIIPDTSSNTLNEALGTVGLIATGLAARSIAISVKNFLGKYTPVMRLSAWNKMRRDKNTFKALGINPGKIREFYKSGEALKEAKKQWAEIEKEVSAGKMTPRQAMEQITYLKKPGVSNKVFNGLTKSYNKKVSRWGGEDADLEKFIKEMPKPEKPGAGFGKQDEYELAMKIWKEKNTLENQLKRVHKDPEYKEWFDNHLDNKKWTENLQQVNKNRIAAYTAFWTLVGGGAGLKTFYFIKKLQAKAKKKENKEKLDAAKKTPVYFKDPVGTVIPLYNWNSETKTWKYSGHTYTIEAGSVGKVTSSTDKTHTLIQFPGNPASPTGGYYWVLTNTLRTAPVVKKKPVVKKEKEPVAAKEPEETVPVTTTPETPTPEPEYDPWQ